MHGPWGSTDSGASESSSTMNSLARVCMYPCSHHAWEDKSSQKDTRRHTHTHTVPWAYVHFLEPSQTITIRCMICSHPRDLLCHFKFLITIFNALMWEAVPVRAHAPQYWHEIKMDDTSLLIQKCFPVICPNTTQIFICPWYWTPEHLYSWVTDRKSCIFALSAWNAPHAHTHTHTVIHTSAKENLREFSISSSPFLSLSACGEHWQESGRREGLLGNGLWLPW